MDMFISEKLKENGYSNIVFYDPIHGFYLGEENRGSTTAQENILKECGISLTCLQKKHCDYLGDYFYPGDIVAASEIIKEVNKNA